MKITVTRFASGPESTLGLVRVDDAFECFSLEDQAQPGEKVAGETRIPAGRYAVKDRQYGGFFERYRARFAPWHRGMLEICDVPGFTDILIHCGNHDDHTAGCVLVGLGAEYHGGGKRDRVTHSAVAYGRFYQPVIAAAEARRLTIEIIDQDFD